MLESNIVTVSDTPYSSPVLLVSRKDGSKRFVVDFRQLNSKTILTQRPLPVLDDILDVVSTQKPTLWSAIDLRSGYFQAELDPETAHKTGFQTHEGQFCFKRLGMGLSGAVPFFQMLMQKVLRGLTMDSDLVYLDDILVLGVNPQNMLDRLKQVFDRFRLSNLRMHPSKCRFSVAKVYFLGHILDANGVHVDDEKIKIVKEFPRHHSPKQVRQ